jgi:hypothetical protein
MEQSNKYRKKPLLQTKKEQQISNLKKKIANKEITKNNI